MKHEQQLVAVEIPLVSEYEKIHYLADLAVITAEVLGQSFAAAELAKAAEKTATQLLDGGWAYNTNLLSLYSPAMMERMAMHDIMDEHTAIVRNRPRDPRLNPRN